MVDLHNKILCEPINFPSKISKPAMSLLLQLLKRDPANRIGSGKQDYTAIQKHPFYADIDWKKLAKKELPPPFKPTLTNTTDTKYFDPVCTNQDINNFAPSPRGKQSSNPSLALEDDPFGSFTFVSPLASMVANSTSPSRRSRKLTSPMAASTRSRSYPNTQELEASALEARVACVPVEPPCSLHCAVPRLLLPTRDLKSAGSSANSSAYSSTNSSAFSSADSSANSSACSSAATSPQNSPNSSPRHRDQHGQHSHHSHDHGHTHHDNGHHDHSIHFRRSKKDKYKDKERHKEREHRERDREDLESPDKAIRASGGGLKAFVSGLFKKKEDKHSSPPS